MLSATDVPVRNAMLLAIEKADDKINIFNLGTEEYCEVNDSIGWIAERLGVSPFTVRAWRHKGQGPRFMKMGRAVRYRAEDVEAFKQTALVDPAAQ